MSGNGWMYSHDLDIVDLEFMHRKFITYRQGCEYYGFGEKPMVRLAHQAGAVYKIGKMVRVNREIFDAYLREERKKNHV